MGQQSDTVTGYPVFSYAPSPPSVIWTREDSRGCGSWTCNILWFILGGGFFMGLIWGLMACLTCLTIVCIPCGLQLFKIAGFVFLPFGKRLERRKEACACPESCGNILWLPVGLIIFAVQICTGFALCCTIIGIPFGIQHFKLSLLALWPFGTKVSSSLDVPHVTQGDHHAQQPYNPPVAPAQGPPMV